MKTWWIAGLIAAVITATTACAKDDEVKSLKHERKISADPGADVKEYTLTGIVRNIEKKKKDGTVMMSWFVLVTEDGSEIHLPKGSVESMVGSKIKVTGMGCAVEKKGKNAMILKTITSIEKIGEVSGAAPVNATK